MILWVPRVSSHFAGVVSHSHLSILQGVKIHDTQSQSPITFIDRPPNSPRADLFKCTLYWQDDTTLLIAWADHIKVARIRSRPSGGPKLPPWIVEVTAAFQLDCMISGILPHPMSSVNLPPEDGSTASAITLTSFLILAYEPPDSYGDEMTEDRARQARKTAERPELRIISRAGEELTSDALNVTNYQAWGCNDYLLAEVNPISAGGERCYIVVSPKDIVLVRPRDRKDHIAWLVEHKRYEEALDEAEKLGEDEHASEIPDSRIDPVQIGARYIKHLIGEGSFVPSFLVDIMTILTSNQVTFRKRLDCVQRFVVKMLENGRSGYSCLHKITNCR